MLDLGVLGNKRRYSGRKAGTIIHLIGLDAQKQTWNSWCFYIEMNKVICSEWK
jgi:hypothetical protein